MIRPFDLRLFVLRMIRKIPFLLGATLLGTLVFGGGYYVKHIVLAPETQYQAVSRYYVAYEVDPQIGLEYVHTNPYSWNMWVNTEEFLISVQYFLEQDSSLEAFSMEVYSLEGLRKYVSADMEDFPVENLSEEYFSLEELEEIISADLESDLRVPVTIVTTNSPELSVGIARAVEQAFLLIADRQKEIEDIRVVDPARVGEQVMLDVRPVRAFVLSGVLSFFFIVIGFALKETLDDNIWLPMMLEEGYGLKSVGIIESKEFVEHMCYMFQDCSKVGVIGVGEIDTALVVEEIGKVMDRNKKKSQIAQWIPVNYHKEGSKVWEELRGMDGNLIVVSASAHQGKQLELLCHNLRMQDCEITSVLLWKADLWLLRRYYRL